MLNRSYSIGSSCELLKVSFVVCEDGLYHWKKDILKKAYIPIPWNYYIIEFHEKMFWIQVIPLCPYFKLFGFEESFILYSASYIIQL